MIGVIGGELLVLLNYSAVHRQQLRKATGNRKNKKPFAQHLRWNNIKLLAIGQFL